MRVKKFNLVSIDILRGFAASAVFFYHYGIASMMQKLLKTNFLDFIALIGSTYAVPLFFLISGFCIHLSQLKQNSISRNDDFLLIPYLKRRFWRIYPTYFIAILFSCAVSAINHENISVVDFIVHIFVLQGLTIKYFNTINLVLWTITIEILFYLLYPVWYYLRHKYGLNKALIMSILISATSMAVITLKYDFTQFPLKYFILNIWGAWCFGAWLCEQLLIDTTSLIKSKTWWLIGVILLIIFQNLKPYYWSLIICYNISIVLWGWAIVPIIYLEEIMGRETNKTRGKVVGFIIKLMATIGLSSYSLYMLHEPLMFLRNAILKDVSSEKIRLLVGVIWMFGTFFLAWTSYQLFEKPFLSYRSSRK